MIMKFIHYLGGLPNFYKFSNKIKNWVLLFAIGFLLFGLYIGLFIAPMDYQQGDAFRIIYIHVPAALLSMSIYAIVGMSSIIYLVWRIKLADITAKVAAPIGAVFTVNALITGAIWGKPMWGTWWVWDARLTSELILLFLYLGYMGLRSSIPNMQTAAKASAVLAVVGLIDLPIIHYSVQWWNTLHQGATITKFAKPSLVFEMAYPLYFAIIGFYLLFSYILLIRIDNEILTREKRARWLWNYLQT